MAKKTSKGRWGVIIGVLIIVFIVAYIFMATITLLLRGDGLAKGNVAVIPVKGVIMTDDSRDLFDSGVASSSRILEDIEDALQNPEIRAILLEINSPGGAPVATDEIARAIEDSNKTTVAWIREFGASGAYWIASSSDYVIANRMSITGSIGVIGSYLDFSGFLQDWNVSYERLVSGKYKDSGVPFRKLEPEERDMLQRKLDLIHQEFKNAIQSNRDLTNSEIEAVGTGEFYLGSEALNLRLIDQLGGKKEAIEYIESKLNIKAELAVYEHKISLFDVLSGLLQEKQFSLQGMQPRQGIALVSS